MKTITTGAIANLRPCNDGLLGYVGILNQLEIDQTKPLSDKHLNEVIDFVRWDSSWTRWLIEKGFIEEIEPEPELLTVGDLKDLLSGVSRSKHLMLHGIKLVKTKQSQQTTVNGFFAGGVNMAFSSKNGFLDVSGDEVQAN